MGEKQKSLEDIINSWSFLFSGKLSKNQIEKTALKIEETFLQIDNCRTSSMLYILFLELSEDFQTLAINLKNIGAEDIDEIEDFAVYIKDVAILFKEIDRKGSSLDIDRMENILVSLHEVVQTSTDDLTEFRTLLLGFQKYLYSWIDFMKGDWKDSEDLLKYASEFFSRIKFNNWTEICMNEKSIVKEGLCFELPENREHPRTFMLDSSIISGLDILSKSSDDLERFRDWNLSRSILEIADSQILEMYNDSNLSIRELVNKTFLFYVLGEFSRRIRSTPKLGGTRVLISLQDEVAVDEGQALMDIPISVINPRNEVIYDIKALETTYINKKNIAKQLFPNENIKSYLTLSLPEEFSSLSVDILVQYSTTFEGAQIISNSCVIYSHKRK